MTKTNFVISLSFCILLIAFLDRCAKDKGKAPKAISVNCDTITYDQHLKPIMDKYCISCHGDPTAGGATVFLNTYTSVKASGDKGMLKKKTIDDASMPLGGPPLSQSNQDLIACWLNNGEKENITYTNQIKPIMDKYCVSCHGSPLSGGASVYLNSYATVKASADNGKLKQKAIVDGSMPYGGPPLSQANKDLITFWLNNGQKE